MAAKFGWKYWALKGALDPDLKTDSLTEAKAWVRQNGGFVWRTTDGAIVFDPRNGIGA